MILSSGGCGSADEVNDLGPAYPVDSPPLTGETVGTQSESPEFLATITLEGSAVFTRPEGTPVVVEGRWGKQPGQFALGEGTPREGPTRFALSPDTGTIAVLDHGNSRVQVFLHAGDVAHNLDRVLPLAEISGIQDLAFDSAGRLLLLRIGPEPAVQALSLDSGETLASYPALPSVSPHRLLVNGPEIWVQGADNLVYPVATDGVPISLEGQQARLRRGLPAGRDFLDAYRQEGEAPILSVAKPTGRVLKVRVVSPELPLDSVQAVGEDDRGNVYGAVRIWAPEWQGTESWYLYAVGDAGEVLGQLRLPVDYWAGGAWKLGADGSLYELRSTQEGVQILQHPLTSSLH